jgi:hypothetical protein
MRCARDFAVGGIRPYHTPERPRVADPERRRRIATYVAGGTSIGKALRTDGVWVWPECFVGDIRDRGLAPERDFLWYMQSQGFRPTAPEHDEHLEREALAAARAGPPRFPVLAVAYFVRVDDEFPPHAPLSLLRRGHAPDGTITEDALWRDLNWHPTYTFTIHADDYDLREVSEAHAAAVLDYWCSKWHTEWRAG